MSIKQVTLFIANQLVELFPYDSLIRIGVCTAFIKKNGVDYDFGGRVYYENDDVIIFSGLPKRIEVDGLDLIELLQWEQSDLLGKCLELVKQGAVFNQYEFDLNGNVYDHIEYVEQLLQTMQEAT